MPGVWWRRQLTRAFGAGGWSLAPRGPTRTVCNSVEYHGALYCMGRWVSEAVGGCDSGYMSHADMVESARTDCLSKACKDLGMASELWNKAWREAWQKVYAETYQTKDGKTRWKLKQDRAPKAADLMRDVPTTGTSPASPSTSPATAPSTAPPASKDGRPTTNSSESSDSQMTLAPAAVASTSSPVSPSSAPVDPITANARKAVKGQMKRLGFELKEARLWLSTKFGVWKVDALSDEQLDNAHSLLAMLSPDDQEPPQKYVMALDNLHANGKVLAK